MLADYLAPGSHPFGPSFATHGQKAIMQSLAAREAMLGVSQGNTLLDVTGAKDLMNKLVQDGYFEHAVAKQSVSAHNLGDSVDVWYATKFDGNNPMKASDSACYRLPYKNAPTKLGRQINK